MPRNPNQREGARLRQKRHRLQTRKWVRELKVSRGCADCGERHPACLQFHHIDPLTKVASIRALVATKAPTPQLLEEIAKCVVLCRNCHEKRHYVPHE